MGYITKAPCTEAKLLNPLSPRSSSCIIRPYETLLIPAHPYFSGKLEPSNPISPIRGIRCIGNSAFWYCSSIMGSTASSTHFRTKSRIIFSSSCRSPSIPNRSNSLYFCMSHNPVKKLMPNLSHHFSKLKSLSLKIAISDILVKKE